MKITGTEILVRNDGPFRAGKFKFVFIKIYTDENIVGIGEPVAYGLGISAVAEYLKELSKVLIGKDPFDTEAIWHSLHDGWEAVGGPLTVSAISAIDIALWDIKGKKLGVPVYKLLGGKVRDKIPVYLSHIEFGYPDTDKAPLTPEDFEKVAARARKDGYRVVKANFFRFDQNGKRIDEDGAGVNRYKPFSIELHNLIRERMEATQRGLGSDGEIIVENNAVTGTEDALRIIDSAKNINVFFVEEPVGPAYPDQTKQISDRCPYPVATGERISTRNGMLPFLLNGSARILMPDVCNTGGISELKKIAELAESFGVGISTHVCGGPINQAASIQVGAVIPNLVLHEHHVITINQYNFKFAKYKYNAKDGYLDIPELPGIGQELSDEVLDLFDIYQVGEVSR